MNPYPHHLGLLGGLLLLAQALVLLLSQVHLAVVEHVVCVEHGEVVHADAHGEETEHADAGTQAGVGRGDAPEGHEHEDCDSILNCETADSLSAPIDGVCATVFVAALEAAEPAAWELVPRADTQTYLLAPKTSPPRA